MRIPAEPSASVASALIGSYPAGRYSIMPPRPLPTETVEFSVSHAADKCVPFVRGKRQDRLFGVSAVADTDAAIG
jgi:hypothetical protein